MVNAPDACCYASFSHVAIHDDCNVIRQQVDVAPDCRSSVHVRASLQ